MTESSLLPLSREFLFRLTAARALAYPLFRGVRPKQAFSGPVEEIESHRPYFFGDDPRRIDWNVFARLEQYFVKLYKVEEELEVLILLDVSSSMAADGGRKGACGAACAASLAYLSLLTSHPVTVGRYNRGMVGALGPFRPLWVYPRISRDLAAPLEGGSTDLRLSLNSFIGNRHGPVTVVIITDGLQEAPIEQALSAAAGAGHRRVLFLRVADPRDMTPRIRGNLRISDAESAASMGVFADRALEHQIHDRIRAYFGRLDDSLRRFGVESSVIGADKPFEDQFMALLLGKAPGRGSLPGAS